MKRLSTWLNQQSERLCTTTVLLVTVLMNLGVILVVHLSIGIDVGTSEYHAIAQNVAEGHGFVLVKGEEFILWRPPLYVCFLAGFYKCLSQPYWLIVITQIVLNAMTGAIAYCLGARIFGRTVAFLAAIGLGGYPLFVVNATRLMPETLFAFLVLVLSALVVTYLKRSGGGVRTWLCLGVVLGLASLLKASIQFFPVFLFLWALLFHRKNVSLRRLLLSVAVITVVMIAVVLPWTYRNYRVSGESIFIDTSGGYTVWIGNRVATNGYDDDPLSEEGRIDVNRDVCRILDIEYSWEFDVSKTAWASGEASRKLMAEGVKNVLEDPLGVALLSIKRWYRFWFSYIGNRPGVQIMMAGMQAIILIPGVIGLVLASGVGRRLFRCCQSSSTCNFSIWCPRQARVTAFRLSRMSFSSRCMPPVWRCGSRRTTCRVDHALNAPLSVQVAFCGSGGRCFGGGFQDAHALPFSPAIAKRESDGCKKHVQHQYPP
jgi:hypothetical protein